jgi:hypothetical protein
VLQAPGFGPQRPVITSHAVPRDWVRYVVVVVAILLGLACPWLLTRQIRRRPKTRTWQLAENSARGSTRLRTETATDSLRSAIEDYPSVRHAAAWLAGNHDQPALLVRLHTEHRADVTELRRRIHTEAIPHLTHALDLDGLSTSPLVEPTTASTRTR